ncbi:hypothetical protein [Intrasporangium calvum]|uniref:DUF559 domain-containing protein n=1 Tax=Intrasporangium calvum (strain ATCC 23552 / DSM 43043 / JCM 3097 / NBRC 12989 / NCIMB 10167 / NRRL B-3866 / 7 KIP) TaxID=710696 RepID=E6SD91_INTC7|nr:hypothetical protein [Intrasporangium calvum]ADU49709.1 hypothetical protein Intca_3225 [Intrasporangium calvum DSM 43043]
MNQERSTAATKTDDDPEVARRARTRARQDLARGAAESSGSVVSRTLLRDAGLSYLDIRSEVAAGRWRTHGLQTVALHSGDLTVEEHRWRIVWETGGDIAAIDGATALQAAGLRAYTEDQIHVSVVHRCTVKKVAGSRLHKVVRRLPDELVGAGLPRTKSPVAALRGAYWAASDRQAALILLMTVQQRLATPDQLLSWSKRLRGRKRRGFIRDVVGYLGDGVQSLGELDFARLCRARGLPEPTRQALVEGTRGRMYLDVRWDAHRLVVEIDGVQHREGLQVSADNLGRNEVTLRDDRVLRIDLIGLRLHEDEFMDQVARGLSVA